MESNLKADASLLDVANEFLCCIVRRRRREICAAGEVENTVTQYFSTNEHFIARIKFVMTILLSRKHEENGMGFYDFRR